MPVAQIAIAQLLNKKLDYPLLGGAFTLTDSCHCSNYLCLCQLRLERCIISFHISAIN
ncbi:hypothetical protein D3C71_1781110 [compost metagenome]